MTRDDDREFWRQQDERRDRDREFWREQDLRDEDSRWDRRQDEARRDEQVRQGWESLRRGNTAWALNSLVGPDAALDYLQATGRSPSADEPEDEPARRSGWPRHVFVETATQLLENVESAPPCEFEVGQPDKQGDVSVRAMVAETPLGDLLFSLPGVEVRRREHGRFWLRASLLPDLPAAAAIMERTVALIRHL